MKLWWLVVAIVLAGAAEQSRGDEPESLAAPRRFTVEVARFSANIDTWVGTLAVVRPVFVPGYMLGEFHVLEFGANYRSGSPYNYLARTMLREQRRAYRRVVSWFREHRKQRVDPRLVEARLRGETTQLVAYHQYLELPHERRLLPTYRHDIRPDAHLDAWVFRYEVTFIGESPLIVEVGHNNNIDFLHIGDEDNKCASNLSNVLKDTQSPVLYIQ